VRIDVEDDGEGVDPLIADRLFEPNVSQRQGGSGLGLALAYAVVDAHGGAIEVHRSRLGGADFRVLLPPTSPEVR
jgi:nitrogen-specific signal transduction histidine kinase